MIYDYNMRDYSLILARPSLAKPRLAWPCRVIIT